MWKKKIDLLELKILSEAQRDVPWTPAGGIPIMHCPSDPLHALLPYQ